MVPRAKTRWSVRATACRPGGAPSGQVESFSFFDTVAADGARGSVTLEKRFLNQTLTQTYTLTDYGVSAAEHGRNRRTELEELTNNLYFIPEQRSDRQVELRRHRGHTPYARPAHRRDRGRGAAAQLRHLSVDGGRRPQVLPFADYGRRSTYVYEMPAVLDCPSAACAAPGSTT